ncbi:MAG TPA: GNAT family N-acetyltransferase [Caulobacteraceae bacterium]|nr:GNAT family N-acetyltransferase [Caulobacteraceae bacterium]
MAEGDGRALRMLAPYGLFAAAADETMESQTALAALCPDQGAIALVEPFEAPAPPGLRVIDRGACVQMLADAVAPGEADIAFTPLGDADASEMMALASLTRPGPFFERTHELGGFIGVRVDGRLAAMAGERMKLTGFTEVSGVCVHPDFRGAGHARELSRLVARRILDRGETPFLHAYASNTPAITLYESLGFKLRTNVQLTVLARA